MGSAMQTGRRYQSPRRAAAAARTTQDILESAATLFVANGYAATTLDTVARAAGVSVPTVTANCANKPGLVAALRNSALAGDADPRPLRRREWYLAVLEEPDARRKLTTFAAAVAAINVRVGPIHRLVRDAALTDERMADLWRLEQAERRLGMAPVARSLRQQHTLRAGLTQADAVTTLWVLSGPETYWQVCEVAGGTHAQYARWLGRTMVAALCG
ncbi:MAG: hypothetical protein NVS3B18_14100 [Candidatus Dormibacteria bacterium]